VIVEEYDEYGEVIKKPQKKAVYIPGARNMNTHQLHRIHETKELFDSDCFLCQEYAKAKRKEWGDVN